MGFRFRRTVRLLPGVRLNFSRSGVSTSLGSRGATINLGKRGTRLTVGVPGTGLSWSQRIAAGKAAPAPATAPPGDAATASVAPRGRWQGYGVVAALVVVAVLLLAIRGGAGQPAAPRQVPPVPVRALTVLPRAANCRVAPAVTAARTMTLARGVTVDVVGEAEGWARIDLAPGECWVRRDLLAADPP